MANTYKEYVAITSSEEGMKKVLLDMAQNYASSSKESGFEREALSQLSCEELFNKLDQSVKAGGWSHSYFFDKEPDTGWYESRASLWGEDGVLLLKITTEYKWAGNELPWHFCKNLDQEGLGWAVTGCSEDDDGYSYTQTGGGDIMMSDGECLDGDPNELDDLNAQAYKAVKGI